MRPLHGIRPKARELEGGLTVSQVDYPGGLVLSAHSHEYTNVTVHYSGEVLEEEGNREHYASTCSVVVKPAGTRHADSFGPAGARTVKIVPGPRWLKRNPSFARRLESYSWDHSGPVSVLGLRLCREVLVGDEASELSIEALFLELLSEVDSKSDVPAVPDWIDEVTELLRSHFRDRLRVHDLAESFGLHPVYFARVFRRRYGCTVGEFVRRLRLEWAAKELADGTRSLTEVALQAGFADQSHLTRHFRATLGFAPGQFRGVARAGLG